MSDDVRERLASVFAEIINSEVVLTDELSAKDVEGWDSLAHINLIYALEDEFGFDFSQREMAGLTSVGDLRQLIEAKVSRNGS